MTGSKSSPFEGAALNPLGAQEDLAFMRRVMDDRTTGLRYGGLGYAVAGLLYAIQCFVNWIDVAGIVDIPDMVHLPVAIGATGGFLAFLLYYAVSGKISAAKGLASRALAASFAGAGMANAILALIFGYNAWLRQDFSIYLLFPVVVAALQGAVWYVAAIINRRRWMGGVAAGWGVTAVAMGMNVANISAYLLTLTLAMVFLMFVPGMILYRYGRTGE